MKKIAFLDWLVTVAGLATALLPFSVLAAPGDLYEADNSSNTILKFTPDGTGSTFAAGLSGPIGLAFDSSGNLFEADYNSGKIFKFTPAGTKSTFAAGLSQPVGLAFDSSGNLFEGDVGSNTIFKFTPDGTKNTFASGLSNPTGLAFDSSGNLFEADQGSGTIFVFTPFGTKSTFVSGLSGPSGLAFERAPTSTVHLANISTRAPVQTGNHVLIGGFIISGTGPKKLVMRALGPTLSSFGVPGVLQNPTLELHNASGALIAFNDNWGDAPNKQQIIDAHLAPPNAAESAILATLDPGNYTAIVRGANNTTGVALVEGYDIDAGTSSKLENISTRGFVQTG